MAHQQLPIPGALSTGEPAKGYILKFDWIGNIEQKLKEASDFASAVNDKYKPVYTPRMTKGARINVQLRRLDLFVADFVRQSRNAVPSGGFLRTEEFLEGVAMVAKNRALVINYLLGRRVLPTLQQIVFNYQPVPSPETDAGKEWNTLKRKELGEDLVARFWGNPPRKRYEEDSRFKSARFYPTRVTQAPVIAPVPIPIPVPGPVSGPVRRVNANLGVDRTSITPLLDGLRMQSRQGTREPSVGGFSQNGGTIPPRETLPRNGSEISRFLSTPSLADSIALPTIPEASANNQVIPAYGQDMNVGGNVPVSAGNQESLLPDPSHYPNSFGNDQLLYTQSTGSTGTNPAAPYDPNAATAALGTTTGNPDWATPAYAQTPAAESSSTYPPPSDNVPAKNPYASDLSSYVTNSPVNPPVPSAPRAPTPHSSTGRPDPYGAIEFTRPASPKKRREKGHGAEAHRRQRLKLGTGKWVEPDADLDEEEEEDQPRVMGRRKTPMGPPPRPQKKPAENARPAPKGGKE
ncbi:hypothetical protein ABKA04_006260 [Annulohypoxylon sp. FPYF3050]